MRWLCASVSLFGWMASASAQTPAQLQTSINAIDWNQTSGQVSTLQVEALFNQIVGIFDTNATQWTTGALIVNGPIAAADTESGAVPGNFSSVTVSLADSVAATGYVYPGLFTDTMNSTAITGGRPGLTGQVIMESATSASNSKRFYAGVSGLFASSASDNGVSGTPLGFGYGASSNCTLESGATYWAGCIGMNASVFVLTGASVSRRFGFQAESDGNLQGSLVDAAFDVWEGTGGVGPSWENGFLVDNSNGVYPITAGGTILKAGTAAQNIALAAGVDLSEITGAWALDAIALPANNGGICWGTTSACGGGEIHSSATSGGPQIFLQTNQFEIAFGSGGVFEVTNTGAATFGGAALSTSPSGGVGYATGAGGTVTQATSKATGVTLNTLTGAITMNNAALAAGTIVSFVLTDASIAATDTLVLNHISGGTIGSYTLNAAAAAGSATIYARNNTAGSLSEAIVIEFAVVKGATA